MIRVWRNIKISGKLLLGFGLILCIFIVSILAVRQYVKIVEDGSHTLDERVAPALELVTVFNDDIYKLLLAMRSVQYTESPEAIAGYREQLDKVLKTESEIAEMNGKYPELLAPSHVVNAVMPVGMQFVDLVDRTILQIEKKKTLMEAFRRDGVYLSNTAADMINTIDAELKRSIRDMRIETDKGRIILSENALYIISGILENIMALRRDAWQAIAVIQAGGGVDGMKNINVSIGELIKKAEELQTFYDSREDREVFENLMSAFVTYDSAMSEFMRACVELDQLHRDREPLQASLNFETGAAIQMAVGRVKSLSQTNIESVGSVLTVMFVSTVLCVVLSILIGLFIARSISRPLNTIVDLAKRAGDGDLTIKKEDFSYEGKDEMGRMVAALSDMVEAQNSTMSHIVQISRDLADGAGDLSAISQETNASMEEIKASIVQVSELSESNGSALEESNASVSEMSSGADTVASSATDSAAFIAQTTDASNAAIQTVHSVIDGMRDVDKNAKESEVKIRQLVTSVENVSGFVSVITGIADQTNLLALNAAIEAARAGEVGRGFAVVAEEVRKLAEESARAAQSVNDIISELQNGAQESIDATTEAGRLLVKTLDQAENALEELNGALDQMNNANESIQNIAAVAEEQAASSKEIAQAIDNVTKASLEMVGVVSNIQRASDETTHGTEGVAVQAEAMTTHAQTLSELLSMFRLESAQSDNMRMLKAG